jgi:phage RecT family recombinase
MRVPPPQQQKQMAPKQSNPTSKGKEVLNILEARKDEIAKLIQTTLSPDALFRISINCISRTPKLQECTALSLVQCIITFAEWGLHPNPALGLCYMVPYKQTATPMLGYRGMLELVRRSGTVAKVEAEVVRKGDHFVDVRGFNAVFEHTPTWDVKLNQKGHPDNSDVVGAYAIATLKDGLFQVVRLSCAEIEFIRSRSKASEDGPWVTDWAEMAKKTALRRLSKFLSFSPEDGDALEKDGDVIDGEVMAKTQAPPVRSVPKLAADTGVTLDDILSGTAKEAEPAILEREEPAHDPKTGEVAGPVTTAPPDEAALAMERLRGSGRGGKEGRGRAGGAAVSTATEPGAGAAQHAGPDGQDARRRRRPEGHDGSADEAGEAGRWPER